MRYYICAFRQRASLTAINFNVFFCRWIQYRFSTYSSLTKRFKIRSNLTWKFSKRNADAIAVRIILKTRPEHFVALGNIKFQNMNNNLISEYRGRCNSCTSTVHCIRHERQLDDSVSKLLAYTTELAKYVSGYSNPRQLRWN